MYPRASVDSIIMELLEYKSKDLFFMSLHMLGKNLGRILMTM